MRSSRGSGTHREIATSLVASSSSPPWRSRSHPGRPGLPAARTSGVTAAGHHLNDDPSPCPLAMRDIALSKVPTGRCPIRANHYTYAPCTANTWAYSTCARSSLNEPPDQGVRRHTRTCKRRTLVRMPSSKSAKRRRSGTTRNTALCMSRDENSEAGRTIASSPILHVSICEPAVSPSLRRIRACSEAGTRASGFLPFRSMSWLPCNAASVNCGFGDGTNAMNGRHAGLSAPTFRYRLAGWRRATRAGLPTWPAPSRILGKRNRHANAPRTMRFAR